MFARTRLRVEELESRLTPSVAPPLSAVLSSVIIEPPALGAEVSAATINGFDGITAAQSGLWRPPDSNGAVGPNSFIEAVNVALAIYGKDGTPITGVVPGADFYAPLGGVLQLSDPVTIYNDITQRFCTVMLDYDLISNSRLDVAISKTNNPQTLTSADWSFFRYDMQDVPGQFDFADYPKVGYNADGFVVNSNMFLQASIYDHVSVIAIGNDGSSQGVKIGPGGFGADSFGPASMHTATPGGPMYFTYASPYNAANSVIHVVRMDSVFTANPVFVDTLVGVAPFGPTDSPHQPTSQFGGNSNLGTRMYFSALRNVNGTTHLVTTHTVGNGTGYSQIAWYDFDVGSVPKLIQQGRITPGPNVDTLMPGIDIAPDGSLGIQYMEGSLTEFISMYATGRKASDPLGTMQAPILLRAGTSQIVYQDRIGDYSRTLLDPTDGTFWGVNEYTTLPNTMGVNWQTWIGHWKVDAGAQTTVTHFNVIAASTSVKNSPITFVVQALDANNNVVTGYNGIVHFSGSDSSASLPGDMKLVNGVGTFTAVLRTFGQQTLRATDTVNSGIFGLDTVTVTNKRGKVPGGVAFNATFGLDDLEE